MMKDHGRLHWLAPGDLDAAQRALYDRIAGGPRAKGPQAFPLADEHGRLNGPFNAMLVSPDVGSALQELGSAIRYKTGLTARSREIAILELSVLRKAEFEWYAHERVGKLAGLTDAELQALHDGTPAPTFDGIETLVRDIVRIVVHERDLDDAMFSTATTVLGEEVLNELIVLIGYYDLLAINLRIWRTPLPDGATPVF
jgi:alkylhydroperoxidase family enzyme